MVDYVNLGDKLLIYNNDGQRVFLDQNDINMTLHVMEHGGWEPHVRQIIDASIKPGDTFIDVGANIGLHSLFAAMKVGEGGQVVCFEPNKRLYNILKCNMETNGFLKRTHLYNMAVSDHNGVDNFYIYDQHASMSGFMKVHSDFESECFAEEVQTVKLDDVFNSRIDCIKVDVEGYEYDVFSGATKILSNNSENVTIIFEWQPEDIVERKGNDFLDKTLNLFSGYNCYIARYLQPLEKIKISNKEAIKNIKVCDLVVTKKNHLDNLVGTVMPDSMASNSANSLLLRDLEHAHKAFYEAVAVQEKLKLNIQELKQEIIELKRQNLELNNIKDKELRKNKLFRK